MPQCACTHLLNIPNHKLNARGPGAFLHRTRRASEGTNKQTNLFGRSEMLSAVPNTPRMRQYRSMQRNKQKPGATASWTQPLAAARASLSILCATQAAVNQRAAHGAAHAQQLQLHLLTSDSAAISAASGWSTANCARAIGERWRAAAEQRPKEGRHPQRPLKNIKDTK